MNDATLERKHRIEIIAVTYKLTGDDATENK